MDDFGWEHVVPWLDVRTRKLGQPRDSGFVFCTINSTVRGSQVQAPYFRMLLKRLAREAGIEKRVNPHALRHGCAFGMAMEGVPLPVVSKQLRHSNIATTSTYLNHVAPELMLGAVAARPAPAQTEEA
jgi:integrase